MVLVVSVAFGAIHGCGAVIGPSIKADVVDYDEYHPGDRKEGTYFAAWNLALKSAMGGSIILIGTVLQVSGFTPNVDQNPTVLMGIRVLFSVLPCLFHILAAALFLRLSFNEREHAELCAAMRQAALSN